MQFEGEVEVCIDDFHLRVTPQNTEAYRQLVLDKKAAKTEVQASPDPYDPVEVLRESGERLTKMYPDALVVEVPIPEKATRGDNL